MEFRDDESPTHIRSGRVIREYFSHYYQRNLTLIGLSFRPLHG